MGPNDVASAGPYCGKNKPPTYESTDFGARLRFVSDCSKNRGGFKAKYKCVKKKPCKDEKEKGLETEKNQD